MTAIRSVRAAEGKFVQISNAAMQDRRLSFTARGILAYVLSLPVDKHLTAEWLESQSPVSRRSTRAALKELEVLGYYRKTKRSGGRGTWLWEQVMSDAPSIDEAEEQSGEAEFSQVSSSDHRTSDVDTSDVERSDKELKTVTTKHEDQKMARERVSRRGRASSAAAQRTPKEAVRDIRAAVAVTCSQEDADNLTDGQVLGLYYRFCKPKTTVVRDLVAHMSKLLADAVYVDVLLANSTPICIPCWHYESDCKCPVASAA